MSLRATINLYRAAHGEPEYLYYKKKIAWSSRRGGRGEHIIPLGDGTEIAREEYDNNIVEYEKVRRLAFLGKYPRGYWRYDKKMVKEGWRERLIHDVEMFDDTALPPANQDTPTLHRGTET